MHGAEAETREWMRHRAAPIARGIAPWREIELQIGAFQARIAARKSTGRDTVAGQRARAEQQRVEEIVLRRWREANAGAVDQTNPEVTP